MKIIINENNVANEAYVYGEIEFDLPNLYLVHEDKSSGETSEPTTYLTEKDIVDRLAKGNEYHLYLLASTTLHKCRDERDEAVVKLYTDAFMKTIEGGNMDTDIRAFEMVIRLVLGNEVRYW